ncbi:MAG TPA: ATPase, partial [Micromonosporaceae bacterium]|nr:ATPase [Micromonosporaceae bacterium]
MTSPRLPRLRPGQLRDQVAQLLAADPARAFTAAEAAAALGGRDTHAVGNALARLARTGHARQVAARPPRFQHHTATTAAAAAVPPRPGAVRRPNGAWYLPRQLAGGTDIAVLRRLRTDTVPALLYGPPGTGKTAMVEAAFGNLL